MVIPVNLTPTSNNIVPTTSPDDFMKKIIPALKIVNENIKGMAESPAPDKAMPKEYLTDVFYIMSEMLINATELMAYLSMLTEHTNDEGKTMREFGSKLDTLYKMYKGKFDGIIGSMENKAYGDTKGEDTEETLEDIANGQ